MENTKLPDHVTSTMNKLLVASNKSLVTNSEEDTMYVSGIYGGKTITLIFRLWVPGIKHLIHDRLTTVLYIDCEVDDISAFANEDVDPYSVLVQDFIKKFEAKGSTPGEQVAIIRQKKGAYDFIMK